MSVTGGGSATIVKVSLYKNNAQDDVNVVNIPLGSMHLATMTSYPTTSSDFYVTLTLDTGFIIKSNTITLTPLAPFTGELDFTEQRLTYSTSNDCTTAGGLWGGDSCDIDYEKSEIDFTVQPVGADVIIRYQPQNLNDPPIVKGFTSTSNTITEEFGIDSEIDYYGSIYVNPEFDYTINPTTNDITISCDPNDILCDPNDNDVPKGTPSVVTFKSFRDPDATKQLGIEPMGNLFGVNMVFIFVIGLAGIFTGRSAPMGVIFIVATLGIMSYLGHISFYQPDATWALLIIAAILGVFIGKRWS